MHNIVQILEHPLLFSVLNFDSLAQTGGIHNTIILFHINHKTKRETNAPKTREHM